MWCPNCNKEYDEGFTLCAKCGEKLVAYTPIVSDQDAEASIFDCDEPTEEEVTKEQECAWLRVW